MSADTYVTTIETLALVAFLVGPAIVIGLAVQYWLYRKRGVMHSPHRRLAHLSLPVSAAMTACLTIALWMRYPALAPNVLDPTSASRYFFVPSYLSAMLIFSLVTALVLGVARRRR